jgi:hypothetical protein
MLVASSQAKSPGKLGKFRPSFDTFPIVSKFCLLCIEIHLPEPSHPSRISLSQILSSIRHSLKSSHATSSHLDTARERARCCIKSVLQSLRSQSPAATIRSQGIEVWC